VTYVRSLLNSAPSNVKDEIEPAFLNDNYWFIFPFHVYWDTSANVTVTDKQKLPIGKGAAKLVSVKYPAEVGGDTPGDTWDLYVGPEGRVVEFIYHRVDRRSRATLQQPGRATRRLALSLFQRTIVGLRTASRLESSSRMWVSSWSGRTSGWTRSRSPRLIAFN